MSEKNTIYLPLYSMRQGVKYVPERSGINQWNANGRQRKFGEAYIPIPQVVRAKHPGFLPERDMPFKIKLPSGRVIKAKVCQQGGKALMSTPNTDLCNWLFGQLDKTINEAQRRFLNNEPYRYSDLLEVAIDSIKLIRVENETHQFVLEAAAVGDFEKFIRESVITK